MPKFRIVKHEQGSKVWHLIEKRTWLFWNRVAYTTSAEEANLKLADLLASSAPVQKTVVPFNSGELKKLCSDDVPHAEVEEQFIKLIHVSYRFLDWLRKSHYLPTEDMVRWNEELGLELTKTRRMLIDNIMGIPDGWEENDENSKVED